MAAQQEYARFINPQTGRKYYVGKVAHGPRGEWPLLKEHRRAQDAITYGRKVMKRYHRMSQVKGAVVG